MVNAEYYIVQLILARNCFKVSFVVTGVYLTHFHCDITLITIYFS